MGSHLRREGVTNNREGLCLIGMPVIVIMMASSMPEARRRHGRKLSECDFNTPPELYNDSSFPHEMLTLMPLGRTMLVNTHAGGWFHPQGLVHS